MTTARKRLPKPTPWVTAMVSDTGDGFVASVPIVVKSTANRREHWRVKGELKHEQWAGLTAVMGAKADAPWAGALRVTLTRLYRKRDKQMDTDNLSISFKAIRDWVAKWLGRSDGDTAIDWQCRQVECDTVGVMVRITLK